MREDVSVTGMDCKVADLANLRAFYDAISRGRAPVLSEPLALTEHDRLALAEMAHRHGVDPDCLTEIQRQLLLVIFGCSQNRPTTRIHLLVAHDGGSLDADRLVSVLDDLARKVPAIEG